MPWPWEEALVTLCRAVEFDAAGACTFAGRRLDNDPVHQEFWETAAGTGRPPPSEATGAAFAALRQAIYVHGFARQFTGVLPPPSPVYDPQFVADPHLGDELSKANQSRSGWSPGWEICRSGENGEVQVRNGDRYRTVPAGQYAFAAGPGMTPQPGDHVSLQILRESFLLQPGMYFAFGETLGDQFDQFDSIRFYFHLDPRGAPPLLQQLTARLNRFQIPFQVKCQKYGENYDRVDAVVLYVARRYSDLVQRLVLESVDNLEQQLRPAVPLLTQRIAAGVGVADDPPGERSFGQDRCELIAAALWEVRRTGLIEPDIFLAALRRRFASRGLSWQQPYLNPDRVEMFGRAPRARDHTEGRPPNHGRSSEFLDVAGSIAHRLCRDALWAADACTWLEWTTADGRRTGDTVFATVGPELYGGTAGIALFLARYLSLQPSGELEIVLRGAVRHALAGLSAMPASQPGLHDGAAGICFAAMEAGDVLSDNGFIDEALGRLGQIVTCELAPSALDVIDGRAGLIPLLLRASSQFQRPNLRAGAIQLGDQLLRLADRGPDGWSWPTMPDLTERNPTGFAHGTAGIAAAMLELHQQTDDARFLTAARHAWRHERTSFDRRERNWPDFRFSASASGHRRCATAWCHGAAGIGLSRLRAWELGHRDREVEREIDDALAATERYQETHAEHVTDFSLCHGLAGNAELFLESGRIIDQPKWTDLALAAGRCGIEQIVRTGAPWPCGGTPVGETPNLMLGLAGIGMFYLRLHDPNAESPLLIRPKAPADRIDGARCADRARGG